MTKWVRPRKRIHLSRLCTRGAAILGRLAGGFAEPFFVGQGFQFVLTCYWLKVTSKSLCIRSPKWICCLSVAPAGAAFCSIGLWSQWPVFPAESGDTKRCLSPPEAWGWVPRDRWGHSWLHERSLGWLYKISFLHRAPGLSVKGDRARPFL